MVRIDKESVKKMAAEMPSTNESNPQAMPQSVSMYGYTLDQFLEMYDRGTWTGGYIVSFGKEFGQSVEVRYKNDVYYLDGYDSEGNPYPDDPELGGSGEGGDDSGLIPGGDDPVAGDKNYSYDDYVRMSGNGTWKGGFVNGFYIDGNGHPAKYGGTYGEAKVVGHKENKVLDAAYTAVGAFGSTQSVKNELIKWADEGFKNSVYMRVSCAIGHACNLTALTLDIAEIKEDPEEGWLHLGEDAAAWLLLQACPPVGVALGIMNATGATDYLIKEIIKQLQNP